MAKQRITLFQIALVCARDMPEDVVTYCVETDIRLHQNDIAQVEDDGNPFAEWLKANGYVFSELVRDGIGFDYIAVVGT